MKQTLKNNLLSVEIDSHGAELSSIVNNITGQEYLWQGDSTYWGRRSPVLFPIVGAVWNGVYRIDGSEFQLGQHGFARDMEFSVMESEAEDEAWFALVADEQSMKLFPFRFRLEIGYKLYEERLTVMWRVKNLDTKDLPFQIGAHPAFNYPEFNAADAVHGYFLFDAKKLRKQIIEQNGCVGAKEEIVELDADNMLPLTATTFNSDAIILAENQVHRVSLLTKEHRPYLSLIFRSPLVGLWSPAGKNAPFVCIEPWWGRADDVEYAGDFAARPYTNILAPGGVFEASYMIIVENI